MTIISNNIFIAYKHKLFQGMSPRQPKTFAMEETNIFTVAYLNID